MTAPQEHAERISAFVDGELSANEIDALLDSLENPACRGQLARYARLGRRDCPTLDISASVASRIREVQKPESSDVRAKPLLLPFRWRPSARSWVAASGLAVAASVATVALNIAPLAQPGHAPETAGMSLASTQQNSAPVAALSTAPAQTVAFSAASAAQGAASEKPARELVIPAPQQRTELEQLYLQHARYRGGYALAAPVSYGRVGASVAAVPQQAEGAK